MKADLAVVGAGPTGLLLAEEVASHGFEVVVLEEHDEVGVPVHCAGLLSLRGLGFLGLRPRPGLVLNEFRGAVFYSPSGFELTVEAGGPVACVVDRRELDNELAERAEDGGVEIMLGRLVKRIAIGSSGVVLSGPWGSLSCPASAVAEGFKSRLVRQLGLRTIRWDGVLPASQVEVRAEVASEDMVEVHLGSRLAPGFFAWVIPLGDGRARVGLACRGLDPRYALRRFLRRRMGLSVSRPPYSGSVIKCGPIPKSYSGRAIVVGDAAGQAKPTTGGGVVLGGICARLAGRALAKALEAGDLSEEAMSSCERAWREILGPEFKAMARMRSLLDRMPDALLDLALRSLAELGIGRELGRVADMDFHSTVLRALPSLVASSLARWARGPPSSRRWIPGTA
ncbi:hypothetical protein DRO32_04085 [Candidatus Bathyarchaeota archaeon]|nr:MAG: hypothetical protein DRO32_04085 [Candidatus Bathyarchaeota archaeon]